MQKNSKQREKILEVLSKKNFHPNAEEIYSIIKKTLPQVGIATIYRNLDQLSNAGSIVKLDIPGGPAQYDGNVEKHFHIRCTKCGKVEDVWIDFDIKDMINQKKTIPNFNLTGYKIDFWGICNKCQK